MEYRIILTIHTDQEFPGAYPDVSIEVDSVVSIIPEGTQDEILGRVIAIGYERINS